MATLPGQSDTAAVLRRRVRSLLRIQAGQVSDRHNAHAQLVRHGDAKFELTFTLHVLYVLDADRTPLRELYVSFVHLAAFGRPLDAPRFRS